MGDSTSGGGRFLGAVTGPESRLSFAAGGTLGANFVGIVSRFVLQFVLAGALGTTSYGIFVTLRSWGELLATLPNQGFQGAVVRFLPEYETTAEWGRYRGLLTYALRLTLIGAVAIAIVAAVAGAIVVGEVRLAFVLAFATVPGWAALRLLQGILQAQHRYVNASLMVHIVQPVVMGAVIVVAWLLASRLSVNIALLAVLISLAASAWAGARAMRGAVPAEVIDAAGPDATPTTDRTRWRPTATRLFTSQLAISVLNMADILILSAFVDSSQVALYAIATRLAAIGQLINTGLEAIVSPRISSAATRDDMAAIQRSVNGTILISTIPSIGFAIVLAVFASPLLSIIGDEYTGAATALTILLIGNIVNTVTGPSGYVVALTDNESSHARIMVAAAVLLVVSCFVVAGPGGIVAVAWARTAANVFWNLALVVFARRELGIRCHPTPELLKMGLTSVRGR